MEFNGATMMSVGPDDKVYPAVTIAAMVHALGEENIALSDALSGIHISKGALASPSTRVSLNQIIACYSNAARLSHNPQFAYQTGLGFHVTTYGMFGFAILSSTDFRHAAKFAVKYRLLAAPEMEVFFKDENERAVWTFVPTAHPRVNAKLYRFLVDLHFGIATALHRDVMGPSFAPQELQVKFGRPTDARLYEEAFGCRVLYGQPDNKLIYDAAWLDRTPEMGNPITHSLLVTLCDELLEELNLRVGLVGKVRHVLLVNLMKPTSFDAIAKHLHMTSRTLGRKLREENTSYRKLVDELRMHMGIKYLRDTDLTIEEIAYAMGFSDAANFRRAFRRWTKGTPLKIRDFLSAT
ncbi:MAG: AraC family transcriptional regulator [Rhodocyclaceae bacterium]|nr:MAG: AraC family transcriptional regulator [Rhodocyclaceae bacterium]